MLSNIEFNGVDEISSATLSISEVKNLVASSNFFSNEEVWKSIVLNYRSNRSNQRIVIRFDIEGITGNPILAESSKKILAESGNQIDMPTDTFQKDFVLNNFISASALIFEGLVIYDKANGKKTFRASTIQDDLNLEFGFLLDENGEKISIVDDESLEYR